MELYPNILSRKDCRGNWREDQTPGELKFFNKLKQAKDLRDWIVFHSVDVRKHIRTTLGELDFLIIMPNKGILAIEIKSHYNVTFNPATGYWKMGSSQESKVGPFQQVEDSANSFRKDYFDKYPVLNNIMCWHLVIFTEVEFPTSYEFKEWEYMNSSDFKLGDEEFLKKIERTLDTVKSNNTHLNKTNLLNQNQIGLLRKIRSEIEVYKSPSDRAKERKNDLFKIFDSAQHNFLDIITNNKRVVIQGAAGTGKTLLAIEVARRNFSEQKKTLFLCFNSNLGQYLKNELEPLKEYVEFQTVWKYLMGFINIYQEIEGAKPELIRKIKSLNISNFEDICECLNEIFLSGKSRPQYESIIIDEAQLVLNQHFIDSLDLLLSGGLKEGGYLFFMDIHQSVKGNYLTEIKKLIKDHNCTTFPLSTNYRNTEEIGLLCKILCNFDPYKDFKMKGSNTQLNKYVPYSSVIEQLNKLDKILFEIIHNEGYTPEEITILSAKAETYETVNFLRDFINIDFIGYNENKKYFSFENPSESNLIKEWFLFEKSSESDLIENFKVIGKKNLKGIKLSTIRKFVGLESPVIILIDLDDLHNESLLYTGITRANFRLYIMHRKIN